ncbi:NahK/ErcS family hybrid sensor histidine kinase/response regulator [Paremcibacter congregatus]|mgnify:CR=1 FL=1|uniref:hybrid sensor histidine kinase/response regulator n=1 Tax=Paremcibacter congregatus TaxID=2043170 RepID=UPI0030EE4F42
MLQGWVIVLISLGYMGCLFLVARHGDQNRNVPQKPFTRALIYSLSLAVYCSSWTYYGAAGSATAQGLGFFTIYLGPLLVILFGHKFIKRLVVTGQHQHTSSIADFISARYGKSQNLATMIACLAVIGSLPYIALQLKSIATTFQILSDASEIEFLSTVTASANSKALFVALVLAFFSIMFGTRHIDATEHHRGLIQAIAFESIIKLVALMAVGLFVTFYLMDGVGDVLGHLHRLNETRGLFTADQLNMRFFTMLFLSMAAIICLPRQFHVMVVENNSPDDVRMARWVFPLYLLLISLVFIPIVVGGMELLAGKVNNPDFYVLGLPITFENKALAILTYLGGFSAATGMVIVACIALSTMICNDIAMPLFLKFKLINLDEQNFSRLLLVIRRLSIILLMLLAYAYYMASSDDALANIGLISFVAASQFLPAILGAVLWRKGHKSGVVYGVSAGFIMWFYTLLLPSMSGIEWLNNMVIVQGPFGIAWLKPEALFGITAMDPLTHGVVFSFLANMTCYLYFSWRAHPSMLDKIQARVFVDINQGKMQPMDITPSEEVTTTEELKKLVTKVLGGKAGSSLIDDFNTSTGRTLAATDRIDAQFVQFVEGLIARAIGASAAHHLIASTLKGSNFQIEDVVRFLNDASEELEFNKEILQETLENLGQAVLVFDEKMNILAWNKKYIEMFGYPDTFLYVGRPVEDLVRYNARQGEYGNGDVEAILTRRKEDWRKQRPRSGIRFRPNGQVVQILSNPIPGGGMVVSFTDITELKRIENALRQNEENMRFYTDNVPEIIAYTDRDYRLRFANKAYHAAYNPDGKEIIGKHIREVLGEEDYSQREPYVEGVLAGEKQLFDLEIFREGQGIRHTQVSYVPQKDEKGRVQGFFALYQDVTDRHIAELALKDTNENLEVRVKKRTVELSRLNAELHAEIIARHETEEALRLAKQQAESATQSKTRFLAAASHDLLQPLNAARLFASVLEEDLAGHDPETYGLVQNISQSLKSSERLLNALLDISKLDAGGITPEVTDFPVQSLLTALSVEFSAIAQDKDIELRSIDCGAYISSDKGLLQSVLQNLISNAIRYTRKGRVLVGCRHKASELSIEIWDTGSGIEADQHEAIFQEFKRLKNSKDSDDKGLGLGLAITDRIIKILGHRITVHSVQGQGSVFRVSVPLSIGQPEQLAGARQEDVPPSPKTVLSVLCVDNEKTILNGMEKLLTRWHCQVTTAADYPEAKEKLAQSGQPLNVAFVDYQLDTPETGLDLLIRLRQSMGAGMVGYIVTADRSVEVQEKISAAGFQLIQKPVEPAALRAALLSAENGY